MKTKKSSLKTKSKRSFTGFVLCMSSRDKKSLLVKATRLYKVRFGIKILWFSFSSKFLLVYLSRNGPTTYCLFGFNLVVNSFGLLNSRSNVTFCKKKKGRKAYIYFKTSTQQVFY